MKLEPKTEKRVRWQSANQAGFSLLIGLVLVLFIAFVAAAAMNLMRIRWAILGFVVALILALIISSLPDIKRYIKISGM